MLITLNGTKYDLDVVEFWNKVDKTSSCWLWVRGKDKDGYGRFRNDLKSHRVSYTLANGDPGSLSVLHSCDNPACVNPEHLFLGTQQDNMLDKKTKGRHRPGEQHPNAKLIQKDVVDILHSELSGRELARKYNVSEATISYIKSRKRWNPSN